MTELKSTKTALITSIISLLLSCVMLLGTTYAWFVDSVSSSNNRILAGNLDVDLLMDIAKNGNYVPIGGHTGDIFSEDGSGVNWEPGKTEIVYLAVENIGSLALKYNIKLDIDGDLAGALEYAILNDAKAEDVTTTSWTAIQGNRKAQKGKLKEGLISIAENGKLDQENDRDYFAVAVHMPDNAANDLQGDSITVDLTVVATQSPYEEDSFGKDYDEDEENDKPAETATITVTTAAELTDALSNITEETVIDATGVTIVTTTEFFNIPAGVTLKGATINANFRGINYVLYEAGPGEQVVFENCTFGNTSRVIQFGGLTDGPDKVVYNNCTFAGQVLTNFVDNAAGVAEFNNCTFTKSTSGNYHYIEAMGGTHNFNICTFDYTDVSQDSMGDNVTNGRINVSSPSDGEYSTVVNLTGCTLTNCGTQKFGPSSTLNIR